MRVVYLVHRSTWIVVGNVMCFVYSMKEPSLNQLLSEPRENGNYDLSKWKYSQLRDIINTSCDIKLLEVRSPSSVERRRRDAVIRQAISCQFSNTSTYIYYLLPIRTNLSQPRVASTRTRYRRRRTVLVPRYLPNTSLRRY